QRSPEVGENDLFCRAGACNVNGGTVEKGSTPPLRAMGAPWPHPATRGEVGRASVVLPAFSLARKGPNDGLLGIHHQLVFLRDLPRSAGRPHRPAALPAQSPDG